MTPAVCPLAPEKNFFQGSWRDILQAISKSEFSFFPGALSHQDAALLMPWTALNNIMGQHRLEPPRMRLVKEGKEIESGLYCHIIEHKINRPISHIPIVHKVYAQMDQGATLVIDGVQEIYPPLNAFVQDMEKELALIMQANLYLSTRTTRGFETHWDDHDVLIVQVHGRKTWSIFGSTRKHPLYRDFHPSCPPLQPTLYGHTP